MNYKHEKRLGVLQSPCWRDHEIETKTSVGRSCGEKNEKAETGGLGRMASYLMAFPLGSIWRPSSRMLNFLILGGQR